MRVEIKSKEELQELDTERKGREKEPIRIVMNANLFHATIKYMQKLVKENPTTQKYVIEYNPNTKELFADITESNEETNVS